MMKVCIITERFILGGLEDNILSFIRFFSKKGFNFVLIASEIKFQEKIPQNIKIFQIKMNLNPNRTEFLSSIHKIAQILKKEQCDIVILHPFISFIYGFLSSILANKPYIVFLHSPLSLTYSIPPNYAFRIILKFVFRYAQKIFCVSKDLELFTKEIFGESSVKVIPNLLDIEIDKDIPKIKWSEDGNIILYSTFHNIKSESILKFLELYKKLLKHEPRELYIYGEGEAKEVIKNKIKELDLENKVHLEGFINLRGQKLREPVFFAVASGRSAIELLSFNLPVLLLGIDGIKGFVKKENFSTHLFSNFSGLYMSNIPFSELLNQIKELKKNPREYMLADLIKFHLTYESQFKHIEDDILKIVKNFDKYPNKAIIDVHKFLLSYFNVKGLLDDLYIYNILFFSNFDESNTEILFIKNNSFSLSLQKQHVSIKSSYTEENKLLKKRIIELENLLNELRSKETFYKNKLNEIYMSRFWKIASKYYKLKEKIINFINSSTKILLFNLQKKKFTREFNRNKRIFIYPPTIDWNIPLFQRPQHICIELSKKNNTVIFCTLNQLDKVKTVKKLSDNLYLSPFFDEVFELIDKDKSVWLFIPSTNNMISIWDIRKFKRLGYKIIYDYIDEIHPDISPEIHIAYKTFVDLKEDDVDIITCVSKKLYKEMLQRFSSKKVLYLPNGVEYTHFQVEKDILKVNDYMKSIILQAKPIIGYFGALASWIDYELILCAAKENPQWNFVLIGANYDNSLNQFLKDLPSNVYYLGVIPYNELPYYAVWFDVALIPFKKGEIAKSTSPIKMYEYMALRKPIVATEDLLECYGYEGVLISKNSCDDFIEKINNALEIKEDEIILQKLDSVARENTWQKRAEILLKYIDRYEEEDSGSYWNKTRSNKNGSSYKETERRELGRGESNSDRTTQASSSSDA